MSFSAWDVKDRIVQYLNRCQPSQLPGTADTSDLTPVLGTVTEEGTEINKAYLRPIENDVGKSQGIVFGYHPREYSITYTSSGTWTVPSGVTEVVA